MAQQNIDFGSFPNDPAADPIRVAFQKVQNNFTELYQTTLSTGVIELVPGAGISQNRTTGNISITANISNIRLSTGSSNSLVFGTSTTPTTGNVTTVSSITPIYVDLAHTITTGTANFTVATRTANFTVTGTVNSNLLPGANQVYNLGSPSARWKDLYLSGNSLTLGAITISETSGALIVPNVTVSGNLAAGNISGDYVSGNLTTAVQPNITSVGTLVSLSVTGNVTSSGNMSVAGVLSASTFSGNILLPPGANIQAPGSNMSILFNDSGNQAAVPGMMFDKANTLLTIQGNISSGNLVASGNATITGNIGVNKVVATGNVEGSNIVTLGVVSTTTGITTGANLAITSISGTGSPSNIVTVSFAPQTTAPFASGSTVTISSVSPNEYNGTWTVITGATNSITFSSSSTATATITTARIKGNGNTTINGVLEVVGNTSIGNIVAVNSISGNSLTLQGNATGNIFTATLFSGNGANITYINGANVSGVVASASSATTATSATTSATTDLANNIRQGSYSNITGVGTLTGLTLNGDFTGKNSSFDGNLTVSNGFVRYSYNNSIGANGATQLTATALTKTLNIVTSVSGGTGVILPDSLPGAVLYVINDTNSNVKIYPSSGQYIDAQAQNTNFTVGPYGRMTFVGGTTSKWYTITSIYA